MGVDQKNYSAPKTPERGTDKDLPNSEKILKNPTHILNDHPLNWWVIAEDRFHQTGVSLQKYICLRKEGGDLEVPPEVVNGGPVSS